MSDKPSGGVNLKAMQRIFSNRKEAGRGVKPRKGSQAAKIRGGKAAKTKGRTRRV